MAKNRLMINNMPLRGGLATAGQRSTIAESQLWGAENFYPDLDSMLRRRPGLVQHGQTLTEPTLGVDNSYYEKFRSLGPWSTTTSGNAIMSHTADLGLLSLAMTPIQGGAATLSKIILSRVPGDTSAGGDLSFKFSMRIVNPSGDDTSGGKMRVRFSGDAGVTAYEVSFDAEGVYLTEAGPVDTLKFVPEYKLDLGGYHAYEFRYDDTAGTLDLWFDGVQVLTAESMASADDVGFTGASNTLELESTLGTTESTWTVNITDLQYINTITDPFTVKPIIDVGQYTRIKDASLRSQTLLASTYDQLYADIGTRGAWLPILDVMEGHTYMESFQNVYIIFDDNGQSTSRVFEWNGVEPVKELDDAPPVRFGVGHRTRLWAAGDRTFPLRLYFTASRRYKVWFAPEYDSDETFDEVLNAGYITIDSVAGDEITGIWGEFYGSLIVQTQRGWWRVTGSSPRSFQVENISRVIGGSAPRGMAQITNDLFGVGLSGVTSINTAQTHGDMQVGMPSGAIADKWSSLPQVAGRVDRAQLEHSYFAVLPSLNIALLGMRGQGEDVLDKMFAYSPMTQQWYGPWNIEATCFVQIEYGIPTVEVLLHGHLDGKVTVTGLSAVEDLGVAYSCLLQTPMYNGRSVDPRLIHLEKGWRTLRLYLLPRVNQTFTVRWRTDLLEFEEDSAFGQDPSDGPSLSDDFILDVDLLSSEDEIVLVEVPLDARGKNIHFELESNYDISLQGMQLEFIPGNEED